MKENFLLDWALKATFITLVLSFIFSFLGQFLLSQMGIIISILILIIFVLINCITDTIGMAVASCNLEPFLSMVSRKEKSGIECINLIKNADKISNICSDIIGDICGILSGAIGTSLAFLIAKDNLLVAVLVSSFVSALTVFFKAIGKNLAVNHSTLIVIKTGKFLSIFNTKNK
ncbi:MAG: hypothetical protein IJW82_05655 [Clostridia bacterium]|nr:hypothetical protein [Clostridia bacterium]